MSDTSIAMIVIKNKLIIFKNWEVSKKWGEWRKQIGFVMVLGLSPSLRKDLILKWVQFINCQ